MARRGTWKPYGQMVCLDIEAAGGSGEGLATLDGARYKVWGALPGERVEARIFGRRAGWRLASLERVERASPHRMAAVCPAFGSCGGCSWQNLAYPAQLALLESRVRTLLADLDIAPEAWAPTVGSDDIWHYRGKIELSFGTTEGVLDLGFNRRGRYWEVVKVEECHIGPPVNRAVIERVRAWAEACGHTSYHTRSHEGFLRYLVIRQGLSAAPHRWLAALVTTTPKEGEQPRVDELARSLARIEPAGSFLWVRSDASSQAVRVESSELMLGDGRLLERLGDVDYVLGLESFFQANARMAARLVQIVRERVAGGPHGTVVDLFCGVGTIALALADLCASVVGVEYVAPAVADAEANARAHGWSHVRFEQGEAERYIYDPAVDLIVLDPPRSGLHPRLPRRLVESPVARLIYVSCNAEALARDLALLQAVYEVVFVQCVDMFPHTPHVETVVELRRRENRNEDSRGDLGEYPEMRRAGA